MGVYSSIILVTYNLILILFNWYFVSKKTLKLCNCLSQCIMAWLAVLNLIDSFVYAYKGTTGLYNDQAWTAYSTDNDYIIMSAFSLLYFITNLLWSITFWIVICIYKA